ncbi:hypothetical protein BD311DRAFT_766497 [Dichomitus squalens]|uniref:Uncharacterized protein n=1 Tax=Dichomitus squalens TaxID=114155 RepID=A0A4V2JZB7_9APHY|nr:hypothetical protein BD311DRAFT_766497 [Dichomitus squalens]
MTRILVRPVVVIMPTELSSMDKGSPSCHCASKLDAEVRHRDQLGEVPATPFYFIRKDANEKDRHGAVFRVVALVVQLIVLLCHPGRLTSPAGRPTVLEVAQQPPL